MKLALIPPFPIPHILQPLDADLLTHTPPPLARIPLPALRCRCSFDLRDLLSDREFTIWQGHIELGEQLCLFEGLKMKRITTTTTTPTPVKINPMG